MRKISLLLVAAVLVAGCTVLNSQNEEKTRVKGLVVEEAFLTDASIGEGDTTELVLRLSNTNPVPVEDVWINVSNRGKIDITSSPDNCADTEDDNCKLDEISGASLGAPSMKTLVWDVERGNAQEGSYPLTISVTYNSSIEPGKSLNVGVVDEVGTRKRRSATFSNSEISVKVGYPEEVESSSKSVELSLEIRNVGNGNIVKVGDSRSVNIGYFGGLEEVTGFDDNEERCKNLLVPEGREEVSAECKLYLQEGDVEEGAIYSLRFTADYRYQKLVETPLEIED